MISHYYGKNDVGNVGKILKHAIAVQITLSILVYGAIHFNADIPAAFYSKTNDVLLQDYTVSDMKIYPVARFFIGFNTVVSTCFTSTERSIKLQVISFARGFVIIIPTVLILSKTFTMAGVWVAHPVSESIVRMMAIVLLLKEKRAI